MPLRESVASWTIARNASRARIRGRQRLPLLQPQVDRQQDEDGHRQLDPEVVRVAGERVHAVDVLPSDRAVDVDLAVAAGDRLHEQRVEVAAGHLGVGELEDAVERVRREPAAEGAEREPVEPLATPGDERDAGDEEPEVQDELDHPLGPLRSACAVSRLKNPIR